MQPASFPSHSLVSTSHFKKPKTLSNSYQSAIAFGHGNHTSSKQKNVAPYLRKKQKKLSAIGLLTLLHVGLEVAIVAFNWSSYSPKQMWNDYFGDSEPVNTEQQIHPAHSEEIPAAQAASMGKWSRLKDLHEAHGTHANGTCSHDDDGSVPHADEDEAHLNHMKLHGLIYFAALIQGLIILIPWAMKQYQRSGSINKGELVISFNTQARAANSPWRLRPENHIKSTQKMDHPKQFINDLKLTLEALSQRLGQPQLDWQQLPKGLNKKESKQRDQLIEQWLAPLKKTSMDSAKVRNIFREVVDPFMAMYGLVLEEVS